VAAEAARTRARRPDAGRRRLLADAFEDHVVDSRPQLHGAAQHHPGRPAGQDHGDHLRPGRCAEPPRTEQHRRHRRPESRSGPLDLSVRTVPPTTADVTSADVLTAAVQGTTTSSVPLVDASPSQGPPPGYRVTAISISPLVVTITGDPSVLQRVRSIVLPAVD